MNAEPLIAVRDLRVAFDTPAGRAVTVDGLSFDVRAGETLGIVGESGSGKSMTSLAILGLLPSRAEVSGSIMLRGRELLGLSDKEMREVRGKEVAMVFQDALAALNPVMTVGDQLVEAMAVHHAEGGKDACAPAPSSCSSWSASRLPGVACASIPTSSPAACGSA